MGNYFGRTDCLGKNDIYQYLLLGSDFPSDQLSYPTDKNYSHFEKHFHLVGFLDILVEFIVILYKFLNIKKILGWKFKTERLPLILLCQTMEVSSSESQSEANMPIHPI